MNELIVIFIICLTLAVAYLWIYPTFVGSDVRKLLWLDAAITSVPIGISALLFWTADPVFRFIVFDTNWFVFTLLAMVAIELPLFYLYIRARGLTSEYLAMFRLNSSMTSVASVEKQLNDTKWDGLRTRSAQRVLWWSSQIVLFGGALGVFFLEDNVWSLLMLFYIVALVVFWFLLRQSVRLVADAPDQALDERLITARNSSYVLAYRRLASTIAFFLAAMMALLIFSDAQSDSDGFTYTIIATWPQVQAVLWLLLGYTTMLPSLAFISRENGKTR